MRQWHLHKEYAAIKDFESLHRIFALTGEVITRDSISDLIKVERLGTVFYIKRYYTAGKALKAFRPRPRIKAEWENLQYFTQWQVPTEKLIAYGMQKHWAKFVRGAIVTQEIPQCNDLGALANEKSRLLKNRHWLKIVSQQIALLVSSLHQYRFVHRDLHWRNILVDDKPQAYIIDCPKGRFLFGPFLEYYKIRDLAYLDREARRYLSRSQRLYFYKQYRQVEKLSKKDKQQLLKIIQFKSKHGK